MAEQSTKPLILASSSPRRRQLMEEAGYVFESVDPPFAEPNEELAAQAPSHQAESLAYFKASAVGQERPSRWVLGADTVVVVGGGILGKPIDAADARRMLHTLSDTRHQVITGVALRGPQGRRLIASAVTFVTIRRMTDEEVEGYIQSGEWEGKAGAYAIQETADRFVVNVEGSFSNIVGLPMELVEKMVREACPQYVPRGQA